MKSLNLFSMPTITFFIRTNVLYCRIRLNGTVAEFSLKEKLSREDFDQTNQTCIYKQKSKREFINTMISGVMYNLKAKAIANPSIITAQQLINEVRKKATPKVKLTAIVQTYIAACSDAPGTIRNHEIKLRNLFEFEKHCNEAFTPESFTLLTANDFIQWFQSKKQTKLLTTANRNVLFFQMCLCWYRKKGNQISSELFVFKGEKDKIQTPVYLTVEEVTLLRTTLFTNDYLNRIKDLFLFQCFTGISYADIWSNWEIRKEEFGTILIGTRAKNNQSFWIPIEDEIVLLILDKYNGKLPYYHNVVYNRVIKEIMAICGINKRVTTHTARKTFATLMDAQGWSRETVSKMLGHKSIKTTELYYLGESFARLENEFRERKKAV